MTQGHHPTHTGLQKHSVGDLYPLAIVGVGDFWELHDLRNGAVLCFSTGHDAGRPVRTDVPSTLYSCLAAHRERGLFCWMLPTVKRGPSIVLGPNDTLPGTKAGFPPIQTTAMDSCTPPPAEPKRFIAPGPLTGSRSNWYGEAGTDADLPPLGAEVKALMTVTEQEQALITAYRYCLPMMRECILTLVRKCKA
jgi:hypothetical protein